MTPADLRKARDLDLLDAVDAFAREPFEGRVWRCVREGRDPTLGGPSQSRWCNGKFDVLCTSFDPDGAVAEIHALLSLQPVFPSKMRWGLFEVRVRAASTLELADLPTLQRLGVDTSAYRKRLYDRTQDIADAAFFLGFDGLVAPSARWDCQNLMLFPERLAPSDIELSPGSGVQRPDRLGRLASHAPGQDLIPADPSTSAPPPAGPHSCAAASLSGSGALLPDSRRESGVIRRAAMRLRCLRSTSNRKP